MRPVGNNSYENYDNWVLKVYKNVAKCNIPYEKADKQLPMCNGNERKKRASLSYDVVERKHLNIPCKTMEGIDMKHLESTMATPKGENFGHFWFSILSILHTFPLFTSKRFPTYSTQLQFIQLVYICYLIQS